MKRDLGAYYGSFSSTGCDEIDAILEAVAKAGKAYHYTNDWDNDSGVKRMDKKLNFWETIQLKAQEAADKIKKLENKIDSIANNDYLDIHMEPLLDENHSISEIILLQYNKNNPKKNI